MTLRTRAVLALPFILATVLVSFALLVRDGDRAPREGTPLPDDFDAQAVEMRALEEDSLGVSPESSFVLKAAGPLSPADLKASLVTQPRLDFRLRRTASGEFSLEPAEALAEEVLYRFELRSQSGSILKTWAFQVAAPLTVTGTSPGDKRANVPINTGIEITFSHDGVLLPQDYVEITPRLEGHFEQHKRTLVFVPRELASGTLYTVRVRPGVPVQGSDRVLDQEYTFQFETGFGVLGRPELPPIAFASRINWSSIKEPPLLNLLSAAGSDIELDIYAYRSFGDFTADVDRVDAAPLWAAYARERVQIDTSRLDLVSSVTLPVIRPGEPNSGPWRPYVAFPEPLTSGYYLLQTKGNEPRRAWLQVTDLTAFAALSKTRTLVWVNDAGTGGPVEGAVVAAPGNQRMGATDSQGVSAFATPGDLIGEYNPGISPNTISGRGYLIVRDRSGREHLAPLSPALYSKGDFNEGDYTYESPGADYWTFVITDRPLYQPADTVHFWGVARPREGRPDGDITVSLTTYGPRGPVTVGVPARLRTSAVGTFEGELRLEGVAVGSYTLQVSNEDGIVSQSSLQVGAYEKPAYRVAVRPERPAYLAGDTVTAALEASFFEGTPVSGLELVYREGFSTLAPGTTIVTGLDGKASILLTAVASGQPGSPYHRLYFGAEPVHGEAGDVGASASVIVFPAAVGLQAKSSFEGGRIQIAGDAYTIDPLLIRDSGDIFFRPQGEKRLPAWASGAAGGQVVDVRVTKITYNKVETGESYDFINKVSRKTYRYERIDQQSDLTSVEADADGRFTYSLQTGPDLEYQVDLSVTDTQGRTASLRSYVFSRRPPLPSSSLLFSLAFSDGDYQKALAIGEQTAIKIKRGAEDPPAGGNNRYLFYEAQRGIIHHSVQAEPEYLLTFEDRHVPSVSLRGVYWNGSTYVEPATYARNEIRIDFNPAERRLFLDIKSEKQRYGPGEKARLEVTVTDANGRPVSAEVNLAAVDEALFAVRSFSTYDLDVLRRLYRPLASGIIRTYSPSQYPHQSLVPAPATGNGDGARDNFEDTALFQSVRTGADGRATITFDLPDNLTTWRVTGLALASDLKAGLGSGSILVQRPFFLDLTHRDEYLSGEKPFVRLRAFGSELKPGEQVQYELTAPSLGLAVPLRATGEAFGMVDLELPALPAGEHKITVRGSSGAHEDSVAKTIKVLPSRLVRPEVRYIESVASSGQQIEGAPSGRTEVTFMDGGRIAYYATLQRLLWAYGDRLDQKLGRVLASKMLTQYFDEPDRGYELEARLYMQDQGSRNPGGVALLPFSSEDLVVTSHVAGVAPDLFGRNQLRRYLQTVADGRNETSERLAIALYGLASLGDPVLARIRALEQETDLGWRGRLYLALAYQAAGDQASARRMLDALYREFGEDIAPYRRLRAGVDQDDFIEATSLAAVLAAGVGDARAESFLRYALDNATADILATFHEIAYVQKALQRANPRPVRFSHGLTGRREQVSLARGRTLSLSLTPSELSDLRLEVTEGTLALASSFFLPGVAPPAQSPDLSVSRSYETESGPSSVFSETMLVKVVIDFSIGPQAPDGCYEITDYLPSGLKAVTRTWLNPWPSIDSRGQRIIAPYQVDGQKVSFCVSKGDRGPVAYYARPVSRGSFTAEPVQIYNQRIPSIAASGTSGQVKVE